MILIGRNSISSFATIALISTIIFISPSYTAAVNGDDVIEIRVARNVADEYLPKYYAGEWKYFHNIIFFDINGKPEAYAFIFRRNNSDLITLQKLENNILEILSKRNKILEQSEYIKKRNDLNHKEKKNQLMLFKTEIKNQNKLIYQWDDFATIITGAKFTSSLVIDHYRGLPPILVHKYELQNNLKSYYPDKNLVLNRIFILSSFDLRYEAIDEETNQINNIDNSYAIDIRTKNIEKISVLKEKINKISEKKLRERDLMTVEERLIYDTGIQERNEINRQQWKNYE